METNFDEILKQLQGVYRQSLDDISQQEANELSQAYLKYMQNALNNFKTTDNPYLKKDDESIKRYLLSVANSITSKNIDDQKRKLLEDPALDKIRACSAKAYKLAENKLLKKPRGEEKIDFDVEELYNLFNSVQPYNEKIAKELISETLYDMDYVENEGETQMSRRLLEVKNS